MRKKMVSALVGFAAVLLHPAAVSANPMADAPHQRAAWAILEDLTTEIGPRLAGTPAEARARAWAVERLKQLGFANVRIEAFPLQTWVRGEERAEIIGANPQSLILTALGNSGATPAAGLTGEVIAFRDWPAFQEAPADSVKGKFVYVGHSMKAAQDGSSYGFHGMVRRQGPNLAAKMGAAAMLIRSIGTDSHRYPHAGGTSWEKDVKPIPAAALSNPDADQLERLLVRAKGPVRIKLTLTPKFPGEQQSGNVIAEIPGSDPAAGLVVIGGHLDSWDLGTGAIDDAAGVAITAGAAKAILDSGKQPRRTIRLVWWGAEEVGVFGGTAYFNAHKHETHALVSESDFGADRVWRLDVRLPEGAAPLGERLARALSPLGIAPGKLPAGGGADIGLLVGSGVPAVDLQQDGTRYFDLHHTPDDTLDKVDPAQFAQNVEAWRIMLDLVANAPEDLMADRK